MDEDIDTPKSPNCSDSYCLELGMCAHPHNCPFEPYPDYDNEQDERTDYRTCR